MPRKPKRRVGGDEARGFGTSLGEMLGQPSSREPAALLSECGEVEPCCGDSLPWRSLRLVVRRERKGHGGKTVLFVSGLELGGLALERLASEVGQALGTRARVEGDELVVHGDQLGRLVAWLEKKGATTYFDTSADGAGGGRLVAWLEKKGAATALVARERPPRRTD